MSDTLTKDQEIAKLKEQNALLMKKQESVQMPNTSLQQELSKLRKGKKVNTLAIPVRDITDHKNIFLYTAINKRIGPLHPNNAEHAMVNFHEQGIQLYVEPRTPEQVAAFKETPEYQKAHADHLALRQKRHNASGKGSFERMSEQIAKQLGVAVKDLTKMPRKEDKPKNV